MITKKIHQIWLGPSPLPAEFAAWAATWRDQHPGWEYKLWSDSDADQFPLYRKLGPLCHGYSSKANLLRLLILASEGGMYADTDAECVGNFESIIWSDPSGLILCECGQDWSTPEKTWPLKVNNAWIYAQAGSIQMTAIIETIEHSYFRTIFSLSFTGDWIGNVAQHNGGLTLLDHIVTNPNAPWEPVPNPLPADCLAVHHWEGSWLSDTNRAALQMAPRKTPLCTPNSTSNQS